MPRKSTPPSAGPTREPRKIDAQGRVHVPPEVMRVLGVGPGDYVLFDVADGAVTLRRVRWVPE